MPRGWTLLCWPQFKRVVAICLAALFFALFLSIIMYARFVRPIQILAGASEQLGLGVGRSVRFSLASDRRDELGELSRALARMSDSLTSPSASRRRLRR